MIHHSKPNSMNENGFKKILVSQTENSKGKPKCSSYLNYLSNTEKSNKKNKNTKEELENSVMEDEIAHAKKNYAPQKGPELVKNLSIDEEFDVKTYNFFLDYIEKFKDHPLSSKIKLVLSYITEVNPHTKREI